MIGVLIADPNEINDFPFDVKETKNINQFRFTIFSNNIVALHTGIGIVNAASATQQLISSFDIKELINYGAVGGNKSVNVYDVITPSRIYFHDVITPWYKRGQTPGEKEYFLNAMHSSKNNNLASGSSFIASEKYMNDIKKELDVDIFDMETAAIAQVAHKNKIPLKVIKVVSDAIGHTNVSKTEDINTRIKKAGKIAFNETIKELKRQL